MNRIDYSDRAIAMRIRQVSQLRKLCLSLAKAELMETKRTDEQEVGKKEAQSLRDKQD